MRIVELTIHNFRSIADVAIAVGDYSMLIGANNAGKSNVIDALRVFYESLKYEPERDFPKFRVEDDESWIDIEYELTEAEDASLKDAYRLPERRVKVRKVLRTSEKGADGKAKQGIYAYIGSGVSEEHFYGAKNVQQGKLGEIIYIPAVSTLDEHTKLSGPSALRNLVSEIVKKLVQSSAAYKALSENFGSFAESFKQETTSDDRSIARLETDINAEISEWEASFELAINPVSESDIVKNLVSFKILDKVLDQRMEPGQFGEGFQRHLVYALIRLAARYQATPVAATKKEFSPRMTTLLFEEPEAYLHPIQQSSLARSLRTLAKRDGVQTILTSHSPYFVSPNADELPSIARLRRAEGRTHAGQLSAADVKAVFSENLKINDLVKGTKYEASEDDYREDMEAVKYFLWLNPERCGAFFAGHVLLVEGPTERVALNYLIDEEKIDPPRGGLFILDCLGKFNLHRFMNLLGPLGVRHSVLFDGDGGKKPHDEVRNLIEASRSRHTVKVEHFKDDIETFLGVPCLEKGRADRKPQRLLLKLKEGSVEADRIDSLAALVQGLL